MDGGGEDGGVGPERKLGFGAGDGGVDDFAGEDTAWLGGQKY